MPVSAFSSFVPMSSSLGQGLQYAAYPTVMSPVTRPRGRGAVVDRISSQRKNRFAASLPENPRAPQTSKRSRRRKQGRAKGLDRGQAFTTQPMERVELHEGPRKKQRRNRPRQAQGDVDVQMADVPIIRKVVQSRDVVMRDAPPLTAPRALRPVVVNFRKRDRAMRDRPMQDAPPLTAAPIALPPVIVNFGKMDWEMRNVVMRDAPPLRDDTDILATALERLQVAQGYRDDDGVVVMDDAPPLGV